jgi:hypothetical protein
MADTPRPPTAKQRYRSVKRQATAAGIGALLTVFGMVAATTTSGQADTPPAAVAQAAPNQTRGTNAIQAPGQSSSTITSPAAQTTAQNAASTVRRVRTRQS